MKLVAGVICRSDSRFTLPEDGSLWLVRDIDGGDGGERIDRVYDFPPYVFLDHFGDQHEMVDTDVSGWLVDGRVVVCVHQLGTWLREPETHAHETNEKTTWPVVDADAKALQEAVRDVKPFSVVHAGGAARAATFNVSLWLVKRRADVCGIGRDDKRIVVASLDQLSQDAMLELRVTHEGALVEVRTRDDAHVALYVQRCGGSSFEKIESADERARLMTWFVRSPRTDGAGLSWMREEG